MTRIVDYAPSDEQSLVSRVLLAVHKAADEAFPGARAKDRVFAKTVIADPGNSQAAKATARQIAPPLKSEVQPLRQSPASRHPSAFSNIGDDSEFDYLTAEKQKSRRWIFLVIVLATAAFVALALMVSNRGFGG